MADETDFEVGHFLHLSCLRDIDLDLGSGHMAYCRLSVIQLSLHVLTNFVQIGKTLCVRTHLHTDIENGFIMC